MAVCVFCRIDRKLTNEHAWPLWVGDVIGGVGTIEFRMHQNNRLVKSWRNDKQLDIKVGKVCSVCNNGWLSELENDSRPLLEPMIKGDPDRLPLSFDRDEQARLALWTIKTATMLEIAHGGPNHVPQDHYMWIYQRREPPPTSMVRLGGYAVPKVSSGGKFEPIRSQPERVTFEYSGGTVRAYVMTMRVGYLVLQAFGYPLDTEPLRIVFGELSRDAYVVIWPRIEDVVSWPKGDRPWAFVDDVGFELLASSFSR